MRKGLSTCWEPTLIYWVGGGGGGMEHEANSHLLFPSLQFGSVCKVHSIDYLSRLLVF